MPTSKAIAQMIFKRLAPMGWTATRMINYARALGGSYRYTEMLADIREYTGRVKYGYQSSRLLTNNVVPEEWMNPVEFKKAYRYKVWADIAYYDPETGEYLKSTRSMYTDTYTQIENYLDDLVTDFYASGCTCDMELTDIRFHHMDVNTRMP